MKNLVIFLAKCWAESEDVRMAAMSLPPDECKEFLIMKWPMVQGTSNQIKLKRISEMQYDGAQLHAEVNEILKP